MIPSATEAKLGSLYITAKKLIPIYQTHIERGWPQLPRSVQTDNTTAVGVVNKILVSNKLKSMDLRYHWLCCQAAQEQIRFYWDKGSYNWGDCSTKHHPPIYHKSKHPLFAGAASLLHRALLCQAQ